MIGTWRRFAALGDSITEGWCDPVVGLGEPWFGWADRLALEIDHRQRELGTSGRLEFANLAVRGRRVRHVVHDQIPAALEMRADLVSIAIGQNDLGAVRADPDALAAQLEDGIAPLAATGATVLLATTFDPLHSRYPSMIRARSAAFTANVHSIAQRHGCRILDLWGLRSMADPRMWAEDRVHPSTRGHLEILGAAARALGMPEPSVDAVLTDPAQLPTHVWVRRHVLPWVGRRVRKVSTGDGRGPKLPEPLPVDSLSTPIVAAPSHRVPSTRSR